MTEPGATPAESAAGGEHRNRVRVAPGLLRAFNDAGVLGQADVHVARVIARLGGEDDPDVVLAAALAVRAPRLGHVYADLRTVRDTVTVDDDGAADVAALPWPEAQRWLDAVAGSGCVDPGAAHDPGDARPLRLAGSRLYLDRYWRYEQRIADELRRRAGAPADDVDLAVLRSGVDRLFPRREPGLVEEGGDLQRLAAATAVLRRVSVIAGGPGTGKTWTAARVLALLDEQATALGHPPPRAALAAPTGKAAERLAQEIRAAAASLDTVAAVRARLAEAPASTLHRLLGRHPGNDTRFRHDRDHPLPHDVVLVDETSMVSLALMAKLLDAVPGDARLILLGDPEQLASVEAGAVLGDIVGPATVGLRISRGARHRLEEATGEPVPGAEPPVPAPVDAPGGSGIGDGIVVLRRVHRFRRESGIAELAAAIQHGDADRAVGVLASGRADVDWIDVPADVVPDPQRDAALAPMREAVVAAGGRVVAPAHAGDGDAARTALDELRVLCAHRRGPHGVATWVTAVERWLARAIQGFEPGPGWYLGRPVMVTANDYQLRVFNGDTGVTIRRPDGRPVVAFADGAGVRLVPPARLEAVETCWAMTVHKSQGSQFHAVIVVLPGPDSRVLTRELLYTAVTRAQERVTVVGSVEAVRGAVDRPVQRASGLRDGVWGGVAHISG
jgi:exodeoxyribonuclease V alpha subunit